MTANPRQMRLTSELVARMARHIDDPGEEARPDVVWCTDADRDEAVTKILAERPPSDDFWVFAYGSLIWNPAFEFVERPTGVVRGFHRSFCLGWIKRFRGSAEYPGLMMALDHGGYGRPLPVGPLAYALGPVRRRRAAGAAGRHRRGAAAGRRHRPPPAGGQHARGALRAVEASVGRARLRPVRHGYPDFITSFSILPRN